uniref:Uncharacterized protein n=1 Tax=Falco tinnunculus TaxID=100819 RepID=A0A8C4XNQ5_FALTI
MMIITVIMKRRRERIKSRGKGRKEHEVHNTTAHHPLTHGHCANWIIPIAVAMYCCSGLNSSMITAARPFYVGAREGHLPDSLSLGLITFLYLLVENVFFLIHYYCFNYWSCVGLSVAGLIYLRYMQPHRPQPLKVNLFFPIYCLCSLFLVIVSLYSNTINSLVIVGITLSGTPAHYLGVCLPVEKLPKHLQRPSGKQCHLVLCGTWECAINTITAIKKNPSALQPGP